MSFVRLLNNTDKSRIVRHFLSLDESSRRLRFCHKIGDEGIEKYVEKIDFNKDIVLGIDTIDQQEGFLGLAEIRPLTDGASVELAFSVSSKKQKNGYGKDLVSRALSKARDKGYKTAVIMCLSENSGMKALAGKAGVKMKLIDGDLEGRIDLTSNEFDNFSGNVAESLTSIITALSASIINPFPYTFWNALNQNHKSK